MRLHSHENGRLLMADGSGICNSANDECEPQKSFWIAEHLDKEMLRM